MVLKVALLLVLASVCAAFPDHRDTSTLPAVEPTPMDHKEEAAAEIGHKNNALVTPQEVLREDEPKPLKEPEVVRPEGPEPRPDGPEAEAVDKPKDSDLNTDNTFWWGWGRRYHHYPVYYRTYVRPRYYVSEPSYSYYSWWY